MKKLFLLPIVIGLFAGCSNGAPKAKYVDNAALGKFPSIFVEQHRMNKELKETMMAKINKTPEQAEKLQKEWKAGEEAIKKNTFDAATAEWENLRAAEVPAGFGYDNPDLELRSAMIEEADAKTGALTINVLFTAKHDLVPSRNAYLNYVIVGKDGKTIFGGRINPFANNQAIVGGVPGAIAAGEYSCAKGSKLILYCGSYDFTGFEKILFVQ